MNSYIKRLQETQKYLVAIEKQHPDSVLWEMLHRASWHYKIDWVMWIEHNKEFVEKIKSLPLEAIIKDEINNEFYKTVLEMKKFEK